jgi:hypothetical protein
MFNNKEREKKHFNFNLRRVKPLKNVNELRQKNIAILYNEQIQIQKNITKDNE